MRFRTKIAAAVFISILAAALIPLIYFDLEAFSTVKENLRAKVLSVAATASAQIDGDLHERVIAGATESSPEYKEMAKQLRTVRDLNRRDDTYVQYVYTVYKDKNDASLIRFGVDPEELPQNHSGIGEVYHKRGEGIRIGETYSDQHVSHDQWGNWLSAYAPIKDHSGHVSGALAVDIPASQLLNLRRRLSWEFGVAMLLSACVALLSSKLLARWVNGPLSAIRGAVLKMAEGDFQARADVRSKDEFGEVAEALHTMGVALAERDQVKAAFARYVSKQVMDSVLANGSLPEVHGNRKRITVMFCDIRGFTTLSERLKPEEVVVLLNEYFDVMVEIVFKYHGTLDKFIGDGLMILFGAPADDPYQEEHAVAAALEMQQAIHTLSARWREARGIELKVGIGIHSGNAVVGNIGSTRRMEYTAIGDAVNLASRLESATKDREVDILISEFTYHSIRGAFDVQPLGPIVVKGREEPVGIYTVTGKRAAITRSESATAH